MRSRYIQNYIIGILIDGESRKDYLEGGSKEISLNNKKREKISKYNTAMENAPPKLLDVYLNLYINNLK